MNQKYKLIIFDWDGTLMDSQQKIVETLRSTLLQLNLVDRSDDELKNVIGLGLDEAVSYLYPDFTKQQIKHFSTMYRSTFLTSTQSPQLFSGVSDMINNLHQSNVMIAIATGKGRQGLEHAFAESGIRDLIHASRCADETFSKPNPQMLSELLDEFSLTAAQAVMVGDTVYDLEMANNINMDSIAVSYGVHEVERLLEYKPLMICDTVEQLEINLQQSIVEF